MGIVVSLVPSGTGAYNAAGSGVGTLGTPSGVYDFSVSRDDIIRQAMLNIGKLADEEVPTPQETRDCALLLNMLVKQWQGTADSAPGLKTWMRRHGHLFLSSTTGEYSLSSQANGWTESYVQAMLTVNAASSATSFTLDIVTTIVPNSYFGIQLDTGDIFWTKVLTVVGLVVTTTTSIPSSASIGNVVFSYTTPAQQPVKIETASLRDIVLNDTPLKMLTVQEYDTLPSKVNPTNTSDPIAIYYENQRTQGLLYTDVAGAQDTSKHIAITYLEESQVFSNPLDVPQYPKEWYLALVWGLSEQIAPMFHVEFTPTMIRLAGTSLMIAQKKEPPREMRYFQPGDD